jgi:hypothetical protein
MQILAQNEPSGTPAVVVGVETKHMERGTLETFTVQVRADVPRADAERAAIDLVDRTPPASIRPVRHPSRPLMHVVVRRRPVRLRRRQTAGRAPRRAAVARHVTRATSPPASGDPDPAPSRRPGSRAGGRTMSRHRAHAARSAGRRPQRERVRPVRAILTDGELLVPRCPDCRREHVHGAHCPGGEPRVYTLRVVRGAAR